VYLSGAGTPGDYLYLDDMIVGDAPNLLDTATAGGEGSSGQWQDWYSAGITASTQAAYKGDGSLLIQVTDPWGWAAQTGNWPGFATTAGNKRISFAAKQGSGAITDVTLRIKWYNANQELLQTDTLPLNSLNNTWQQTNADVTAPAGTASAYLDMYGDSGDAGDSLYVDNLSIISRD